jgi:primosomal protein N' (replication factor Y)
MIYPPFCDIAQIVVQGAERQNVEDTAKSVANSLKLAVEGDYQDVKLIVLGPTVAQVPKLGGKYRYRLIVKFKNSKRSRELFSKILMEYGSDSKRAANVYIDINPESMI